MEWSDAELCSFLDLRGPAKRGGGEEYDKGDLLCHGKLNLTSSYLALPCIALQLIPAKCTPRTHQRNEKIVLLEYHTGLMITCLSPPSLRPSWNTIDTWMVGFGQGSIDWDILFLDGIDRMVFCDVGRLTVGLEGELKRVWSSVMEGYGYVRCVGPLIAYCISPLPPLPSSLPPYLIHPHSSPLLPSSW